MSCERLWNTLNSICECRQTVEHVWHRLFWPDQRIGTDISTSHCVQTISIVPVRAISQHTMPCLQPQCILYATVKLKKCFQKSPPLPAITSLGLFSHFRCVYEVSIPTFCKIHTIHSNMLLKETSSLLLLVFSSLHLFQHIFTLFSRSFSLNVCKHISIILKRFLKYYSE